MRLIAVLLLVLGGYAGVVASETEVRLVQLPDKAYEVQGAFEVSASSSAVWKVLTDYEGIPAFVSSMKVSRVREMRADGSLLVEQKATGGMFILRRTVTILLEVRREPQSLRFEDVGRESFWRYEGEWRTENIPNGARVTYRLIAQPDFMAPAMVMSRAVKRGALELLDQVRAEIVRRSNL